VAAASLATTEGRQVVGLVVVHADLGLAHVPIHALHLGHLVEILHSHLNFTMRLSRVVGGAKPDEDPLPLPPGRRSVDLRVLLGVEEQGIILRVALPLPT